MANHFRLAPNLIMGVDKFSSRVRRLATNHSKRIKSWVDRKKAEHEDRSAIKLLLNTSDRELFDIGVTKGAVLWASKLPTGQSKTQALQKIARDRKHSENKAMEKKNDPTAT